jgi:peptide chain release factor 2
MLCRTAAAAAAVAAVTVLPVSLLEFLQSTLLASSSSSLVCLDSHCTTRRRRRRTRKHNSGRDNNSRRWFQQWHPVLRRRRHCRYNHSPGGGERNSIDQTVICSAARSLHQQGFWARSLFFAFSMQLLLLSQRNGGTVAAAAAAAWGVHVRPLAGGAVNCAQTQTAARCGMTRFTVRMHEQQQQQHQRGAFMSATTRVEALVRSTLHRGQQPLHLSADYSESYSTSDVATTTESTVESSLSSTTFEWESALLDAKRDLEQASLLYAHNVATLAGVTLAQLDARIFDYEREQAAADADFWSDANAERAAHVHEQWSRDSQLRARLQNWQTWQGDAHAALEMLTGNHDDSLSRDEQEMLLQELQTSVQLLLSDGQKAELEWLLSGPYDHCAARLTITAGAGGTEANDWVSDLYRMYTRYVQQRSNKDGGAGSWTCQLLDATPGDVVGYKSVELLVTGPYAYGWLHAEKGAHRLVRLSPFNAKDKRQTTFAGVDVAPEVPTAEMMRLADIHLPESELEITTMRSGGKGGQNVNKVSSAVRIRHVPSGLVVKCTQERSQSQNRDIALNRLRVQLLAIAQEQRVQEIRDIRGDMVQASWGAQIRNYVLHPYKQVKDPRTGWESTNAQAFLDGDLLDECIGAYLRFKKGLTDGTGTNAS